MASTSPEHEYVGDCCSNHIAAFKAIGSALFNHIWRSLCQTVGQELGCWQDVKQQLGIYNVTHRTKSRPRVVQKLAKLEVERGVSLTRSNFQDHVPDLVAARVVCLHPDDLLKVAIGIRQLGDDPTLFRDPPVAFRKCRVRRGILSVLPIDALKKAGFEVDDPHAAGYTSIHFVFRLGPDFSRSFGAPEDRASFDRLRTDFDLNRFLIEVQLRTLLEEAWAEVDHWIRYEDDRLVENSELINQFRAMAAYIQAGNHHISLIRQLAASALASEAKYRAPDFSHATDPSALGT